MLQFIMKLLGLTKVRNAATVKPFTTKVPVKKGKEGKGYGRITNVTFDGKLMHVVVAVNGNRPLEFTGKIPEFKAERMVRGWTVNYRFEARRLNTGNTVNVEWKEA